MINNRGLQGLPTLSYVDAQEYAGADVFADLTFLDHSMTPFTPTSLTYQLDDITNNVNMIPSTVVTTGLNASPYVLQLPAASMVMTRNWGGSQLCQLWVQATGPDANGVTITIQGVFIIELCSIQTPATTT